MTHVLKPIIVHELELLARNTMMWFRFALFYFVFAAAMTRDILNAQWDRFSMTLAGLMVVAAIGVASALSAETFANEKERGTMEALLLAPTSANDLVRAKMLYVTTVSIFSVWVCLLTGAALASVLGESATALRAVNRITMMTAFLCCPPAVVITTSIGIIVSSRVSNLQHASAAATVSGIGGMLIVIIAAYVLSTSTTLVIGVVTGVLWTIALLTYQLASSTANPQVMIRTRGR